MRALFMGLTFMGLALAAGLAVGGPAAAQGKPSAAPTFTYAASAERRRTNFTAIINQYRRTAPGAAAQLDTLIASQDVGALLQKGFDPLGLRTDNVADVYAVWWVSHWLATRGKQDTPTRAQMAAVKRQAERALGATASFSALGDAKRQEMADSLLFQTMLVDTLMDAGKANPQALNAAAMMARTNAGSAGLDLARIELTPTGFTGQSMAATATATPAAPARGPVARAVMTKTPPAAAASASAGPAGLVGMWRSDWVENQYRAFTGLTLVALNNTLVFTRGGYFIEGVPEGAGFDDAGAQAIIARDPKTAGRYVIQPGKIVLNYADGNSGTVEAKRQGNSWTLNYDGKWMSQKILFPDGATLSGLYTNENITNAGSGIFVVGDRDFSFAPDGRFARGSCVSMSAPAFSSRDGGTRDSGRYRIQGSALILEYAGGRREVMSIFQETRGEAIWLNDVIYKPAR
jgi:hypothetical protein